MASFQRKAPPPMNVRLLAEGTRVVLLRPPGLPVPGVVTDVRTEPHLRPYIVICDDGTRVFASAHDLALEVDVARTPLGLPPVY